MRRVLIVLVCAALTPLVWKYVIPHHHFALDGTFFLLQRITKPTAFGVYSLAPGSEVHRVAQQGSKLTVSDGREQFEVDAFQLTNDLDIAADLQKTQDEEKQRTRAAVEQEKRRVEELQRQMYQNHAQATEGHEKARRETVRPHSALDRGAYNQQEGVARAPEIYPVYPAHPVQPTYTDTYGRRYWIDRNGHKHYVPR